MEKTKELPFEPAPGSRADVDYKLWSVYLDESKSHKLTPSIRDYLIWLEDSDEWYEEHDLC